MIRAERQEIVLFPLSVSSRSPKGAEATARRPDEGHQLGHPGGGDGFQQVQPLSQREIGSSEDSVRLLQRQRLVLPKAGPDQPHMVDSGGPTRTAYRERKGKGILKKARLPCHHGKAPDPAELMHQHPP